MKYKSNKKAQFEKMANEMANMIIKGLEENKTAIWTKPWAAIYYGNLLTGSKYRGFNPLWCNMYNLAHGYSENYFITPNQLFSLAKQNETFYELDDKKRFLYISFAKPFKKTVKQENGENKEEIFFTNKVYKLYNIQQVKNYKAIFAPQLEKKKEENITNNISKHEDSEKIINNYLRKEKIQVFFNSPKAYYVPLKDQIYMPNKDTFKDSSTFYSVYSHEIGHSTGIRLGRFKATDKVKFGDDVYSEEELVAEIFATLFCSYTNIANERSEHNSEAYLLGWARKFKENPEIIFEASKKAQKAIRYFLDDIN